MKTLRRGDIMLLPDGLDECSAIRYMLENAASFRGAKPDLISSLVRSLLAREELGTTGIGRGLAFPHVKHPGVDSLVMIVACAPNGIKWPSVDGDPVKCTFMLVCPADQPGGHLRHLEALARLSRNDTFRRFLSQARSREEIAQLFEEAVSSPFGNDLGSEWGIE